MRIKKCLIIENEPYLSESLASKIEEIGFESHIVSSTAEALQLDDEFSALLLSSNLHDEKGFFKVIKQYKKATIILMISYINNDLITRAVDYGADDYILKPFKTEVLVRKLATFQKIHDLQDREKKYLKFMEVAFGTSPIEKSDEELRLPLAVISTNSFEIDKFVFFFAKSLKKLLKVVSFKDLETLRQNRDSSLIYYLRNFDQLTESEMDETLSFSRKLDMIVGSSTYDDFHLVGFDKKDLRSESEIEKDSSEQESAPILTVADYIKKTILDYQYQMPDTEISKHLGISRKSLWERRRKFNIKKQRK
jgi:DNA-binding response OmpR family regulator